MKQVNKGAFSWGTGTAEDEFMDSYPMWMEDEGVHSRSWNHGTPFRFASHTEFVGGQPSRVLMDAKLRFATVGSRCCYR